MLRLTLSQMRHSTGRLIAAGVAIVVGTAFIAATLIGSAMIRDTTYSAMTAEIADADVVAQVADSQPFTPEDLAAVRALPGVLAADGRLTSYGTANAAGRQAWVDIATVPAAGLATPELDSGELPRSPGQVALTESVAERLQLGIGDSFTVDVEFWLPDEYGVVEDTNGMIPRVTDDLSIVGLLPDPLALAASSDQALVAASQRDAWATELGRDIVFYDLLIAGHDGVSDDALAAEVAEVLPGQDVSTARWIAELRTSQITGQNAVFTALVLAFGAVAMAVAAIVITNTFQVVVAQRAHTLALLRAVGATKRQVRRSVLVEALLLGVLGGIVGLAVGLGLARLALTVLGSQDLGIPLPDTLSVTPAVVLVPILTGAIVTFLAALAPARTATRVSPLAALRPPEPPDPRGASRLRLITSIALLLLGGAMLVAGPLVAGTGTLDSGSAESLYAGLALGIAGGVIAVAGLMLGVVFIAPGIVRGLGALAARLGGGSTVRLATANATRNPRRTAATATALLIGVGLVSLMSTGAVTARASLDAMLRAQFPVDLTVESSSWHADTGRTLELSAAEREVVATTPGVGQVLEIEGGLATVTGQSGTSAASVEGIDPAAAADVMLDPSVLAELTAGTTLVRPVMAKELGLEDGEVVTVGPEASNGPATGATVELAVVVVPELTSDAFVVTPEVLAQVDPERAVIATWARFDGTTDEAESITLVQDRLTELDAQTATVNDPDVYAGPPWVSGPAAERVVFEQVIDTLLAIVVGLLGVAVVIALIGVANTLSLSVIERRRESAVLRAIGLTRGQLRGMLAVEGVFLAVVGVLIGAVFGVLCGWSGAGILFGQTGGLALAVPWAHLGVIVVVAVLAGLVASVLPARSAVRTPPVAALAAA